MYQLKNLTTELYNDAEKYAKQIIKYPKIKKEDLISFLSVLATCANKKGNKKEELNICEKLLTVDKEDPKIIVSYAFALMENKQFEKSKYFLEKCIEKGYHDFKVYNYLALVAMYGDKNFVKAYSYLDKISEISHNGQKLNDRDRYVMYINSLSISGLSGNEELLKNIQTFKHGVSQIKEKEISNEWVKHAEICEFINIGIAKLLQGENLSAKSYFDKIQNYNKKGEIIRLSEFLSKICLILEENSKIQDISDVVSLYEFVNNLETITLFEDYKKIINQYYSLVYSFWSILIDKQIDIDIEKNREKLQQYSDLNLTTSDFIKKSFSLLKLIETYNNDFKNSILKERGSGFS
jgi:predicted O-linked N-acetylglucosamine transferase (SPINDLY family)